MKTRNTPRERRSIRRLRAFPRLWRYWGHLDAKPWRPPEFLLPPKNEDGRADLEAWFKSDLGKRWLDQYWEMGRLWQELYKSTNEGAMASANMLLRSLLIVNGGAVAAIIAYLGTKPDGLDAAMRAGLVNSAGAFALGTLLTLVTAAFAYYTNRAASAAMPNISDAFRLVTELAPVPAKRRAAFGYNLAFIIANVMGWLSFVCVVVGVYSAWAILG